MVRQCNRSDFTLSTEKNSSAKNLVAFDRAGAVVLINEVQDRAEGVRYNGDISVPPSAGRNGLIPRTTRDEVPCHIKHKERSHSAPAEGESERCLEAPRLLHFPGRGLCRR